MRKIKVLQIGGNTQKNGINTFLLNSYKLMREDFSFVFINTAFRESDLDVRKTIEKMGGKIYHLPYKQNTSDVEAELKEIITIERPDVIHCHYFYSNGDYMRIGYEMDIPVRIAHCHNDKSGYLSSKEQTILSRSRELTEQYATVKFANSLNAGKFFYGDYLFDICYEAVETSNYFLITDKSALFKKHKLDMRFKYSLFVGRFSYQKNVMFLIDVMKGLPDRKLIMVGEGNLKDEFIKRIEAEMISERFIFMSDNCLNELYNIADSFLLPSLYEGLGVVFVEAQCAGTPCFTSNLIPKEADLGMVEFLPLESKIWIERLKKFERAVPRKIDAFKFDTQVVVNNLKERYLPSDEYINLAKGYMLGNIGHFGNRKKAVENFKIAHELENIRGSFYYALQFFEGSGVAKDIPFAISIANEILQKIEHMANDGQAEYILILADMYSFGLGKPQSFKKAGEYYITAAELGNFEAMCDLGYMYSVGQGVEKDLAKSFYWYEKSANGGYLHSMRDVGQCYYFGLGTEIDYAEAVKWFEKASKQNYSHATCDLARCYLEGLGVEKSLIKAAEAYLLAIKQDHARAVRDLIAHSIDVEELLKNGQIKFLERDKIESIDCNNFADGTLIINAKIRTIESSIFYNHTDIIKFFAEKENPYYKTYAGVLYSKDGETLVHFPLGSPITEFVVPDHVKHIGAHAFQNCRNLQSVILHNRIETIGDSAFDDCKNMTHIQLPLSVKNIGAWAFHGCDKIEEFRLSENLTKIGQYAFGSCERLKRIVVSSDNPNYASNDWNLYTKDLSTLLQYAIGKSEKLFALLQETKMIAFRAFSDAFRLEYVDATPAVRIEEKAFYWCSNLKEILLDETCIIEGHEVFNNTANEFKKIYRKRGRIILLADVHGHLRLDLLKEKLGKLSLKAKDIVVILGDAGIVWQEPMRDDVKTFYSNLPCDVLFVDGNHENFDLLYKMRTATRYGDVVHEVLPNVFHLLRGKAYLINGKKCFVFGGAYSMKKEDNSSPVQIWDAELPSKEEYCAGEKTVIQNEKKFDFILSHQAPKSLLDKIGYSYAKKETELLCYLEKLKNSISFDCWYFGHIHKDFKNEKFVCLYESYEVIE
jgi:TPR repeat protein/glycosyltransferase involved in cell wall biosynthesis/predicted phosphodiesterase